MAGLAYAYKEEALNTAFTAQACMQGSKAGFQALRGLHCMLTAFVSDRASSPRSSEADFPP